MRVCISTFVSSNRMLVHPCRHLGTQGRQFRLLNKLRSAHSAHSSTPGSLTTRQIKMQVLHFFSSVYIFVSFECSLDDFKNVKGPTYASKAYIRAWLGWFMWFWNIYCANVAFLFSSGVLHIDYEVWVILIYALSATFYGTRCHFDPVMQQIYAATRRGWHSANGLQKVASIHAASKCVGHRLFSLTLPSLQERPIQL